MEQYPPNSVHILVISRSEALKYAILKEHYEYAKFLASPVSKVYQMIDRHGTVEDIESQREVLNTNREFREFYQIPRNRHDQLIVSPKDTVLYALKSNHFEYVKYMASTHPAMFAK